MYNDKEFSTSDWKGIISLGISFKEKDPLKIGRFGLGFKSVFHLTGILFLYKRFVLLRIVFGRKQTTIRNSIFRSLVLVLVKTCIKQTTFCFDVAFLMPWFSLVYGFQIFHNRQVAGRILVHEINLKINSLVNCIQLKNHYLYYWQIFRKIIITVSVQRSSEHLFENQHKSDFYHIFYSLIILNCFIKRSDF